MHTATVSARSKQTARGRWMGLAAAVGLAMTLTPGKAHAQFGNQGAKPLGAVLGVPVRALGDVIRANAFTNNVNVLHISQAAFGGFNNQIATVGISQRNTGLPNRGSSALVCKLPKVWLPAIKQINANTTIVEQVAVGDNNTQVATVEVGQSNQAVKPGSRFMLVPGQFVGPLVQLNANVTVITQIAVGDNNTQVAVVNVDQSNGGNVNVPANAVNPLIQINANLTIITQVAVGNNNTQVATVNVGQSNG
jgi:hypothetical protein